MLVHTNFSRRANSWGGGCDAQQLSCIRDGVVNQIAVGGASRWTAVELYGQLTTISAHLPHKGKKLV